MRTMMIGIAGTFLACFDLLSHFATALDVMGVFIASMGAVIITRYAIKELLGLSLTPKDQTIHLIAWSFGIVLGFLSIAGITVTGIALLDSMIAASAATFLTLTRRESYEEAYFR